MGPQSVVLPPSVKVGGKPYFIRFGNGALYLLSTWGLEASSLIASLNEQLQAGRYTEVMLKIAAASLGTIDRDGNWRSLRIDPVDLADRLLDDEINPLIETAWQEFAEKNGLEIPKKAGEAPASPSAPASGSTSGPSAEALQA